jgi:DNA polymerase I-like protein with 3'-5' exonuclease and polymerase domains
MANHPHVLLWRERVVREVLSPGGSRTYTNPFGQKRYFSGWGPEVERQLFNYPCQSTAMDLISEAQVELHRRGCPIILQHHDSLVAEVPEGEVDRWASLMQSIMTCPRPEIPDLPLAVDVEVGRSWGTLRPI